MNSCGLGEKIALLRKSRNLTQSDLAQLIGKSTSTVAMWETGQRDPDTNMIVRLSDLFKVSSDYLLGIIDNPNANYPKESVGWIMSLNEKGYMERLRKNAHATLLPLLENNLSIKEIIEELNALFLSLGRTNDVFTSDEWDLPSMILHLEILNDQLKIEDHTQKQKDILDFKKILQDDVPVMFDGVLINDFDREKVLRVMEAMFWDAKEKNKNANNV